MKEFEQAYSLADQRNGPAVLERNEAAVLWNEAAAVPEGGHIVEIGCELGRSSAIIAAVAQEHRLHLSFVDFWVSGQEIASAWFRMMYSLRVQFTLYKMRSEEANHIPTPINLLYIDGDHTRRGFLIDAKMIAAVVDGGAVLIHDYGRYPELTVAIDEFHRNHPELQRISVTGTMALYRVQRNIKA